MRFWFAFVLALAAASAQTIEFGVVDESALQQRLRLAHRKNAERYARLKSLFELLGCNGDYYREQSFRGSKEPTMICTIPGTAADARRIVVGAHYDADGGDGVIDNWSGAILLPSLASFIRNSPRRHTFEFVAFSAEETGLLGSRAYLKSQGKADREQIVAAVTLDSLGLGPAKCWPNGSTEKLLKDAFAVAIAMKLDFRDQRGPMGTTDSQRFKQAGIPVLSLHSVTPETWKTINSKRDVWSAVSWKHYYDTHRFVSALLAYLDVDVQ